jgi:DGQHR domain-containing protein
MTKQNLIKIPALEFKQGNNKKLYCFAVNGKLLPDFTTISRISRDKNQEIDGYQRPEVISHISNIKKYLESPNPMIPNAIVVAFNNKVSFQPMDNGTYSEHSKSGLLKIPINDGPNDKKPGWIVDGQQRIAAIRDAEIKNFPIAVVGFITGDETEQREQFILVNSTKPLPKGLIYELLPTTDTELPIQLQRKRFPSEILQRLNCDTDSPLFGMISTPTTPKGIIKDNSILKMLENSLSDGTLFQYRENYSESKDMDSILKTLKSFWGAVAKVFKEGWNLQPRKSRLMHGAGIVSMGFLMDAISDRFRHYEHLSQKKFEDDLSPIKDFCRWTNGFWDFGGGVQRKWNEIQNTPKDIQLLANYILNKYREKVQNK